MEGSVSLQKGKRTVKSEDDHAPLLRSKKALKAFHEKCLDFVREKNVTYLNPEDLIELLGGSGNVSPAFVKDLMNVMVANNFIQYFETEGGKPLCKPILENKGVDVSTLNLDEKMIYEKLQHAGNSGIWKETLQRQLNIPQNAMTKALKSLEGKKIIKRVKSVKHKLRVILMLYNLEPADDLTGGPWYAEDNTLDEAFVNDLLEVVVFVVEKKSYPPQKKVPLPNGKAKYVARFYQPTYRGYATAEDVYEYIINSKILQDDVKETFGVSQVHQLLEVACLSGSIHKRTDGVTYRGFLPDYTILDPDDIDVYYNDDVFLEEDTEALLGHNGFTEAPCGRCPVFRICGEPGEEISASNCKYWDEWTSQITPVEYF